MFFQEEARCPSSSQVLPFIKAGICYLQGRESFYQGKGQGKRSPFVHAKAEGKRINLI